MSWKCLICELFLCVCLTGCGGTREPAQQALDFRTALMEAEGCSFQADVTADYGDAVYRFTVDCRSGPEETRIRVLKPESLAGIAATVSADGTELEFEDVQLEYGPLANGFVSPVRAPWLLTRCWIGEYIAWAGADGDLERVSYLRGYDDEELQVDTWFTADGTPIHAEMFYDQARCLTLDIRSFTYLR